MKELADTLVPCLHSLSISSELRARLKAWLEQLGVTDTAATLDVSDATRLAKVIYAQPMVRHGVRFDLAFQACDVLLAGAEQRAAVLIDLVGSYSLSQRAAAFMDRATRLFLWGFEPEAVVMCASVLEAAYEQRFPPEEMFRLQIRKVAQEFEAYQYEEAAVAAKAFSVNDKQLARSIRRARNDTLHNAPNVALDAEQVLRATASLLTRLFPS
jgi:hypothetical protein